MLLRLPWIGQTPQLPTGSMDDRFGFPGALAASVLLELVAPSSTSIEKSPILLSLAQGGGSESALRGP